MFTEIFEPFPDAESVVTTMLSEENGKTRITVDVVYPSKEVRDMVLKTGMEKGAAHQLRPARGRGAQRVGGAGCRRVGAAGADGGAG